MPPSLAACLGVEVGPPPQQQSPRPLSPAYGTPRPDASSEREGRKWRPIVINVLPPPPPSDDRARAAAQIQSAPPVARADAADASTTPPGHSCADADKTRQGGGLFDRLFGSSVLGPCVGVSCGASAGAPGSSPSPLRGRVAPQLPPPLSTRRRLGGGASPSARSALQAPPVAKGEIARKKMEAVDEDDAGEGGDEEEEVDLFGDDGDEAAAGCDDGDEAVAGCDDVLDDDYDGNDDGNPGALLGRAGDDVYTGGGYTGEGDEADIDRGDDEDDEEDGAGLDGGPPPFLGAGSDRSVGTRGGGATSGRSAGALDDDEEDETEPDRGRPPSSPQGWWDDDSAAAPKPPTPPTLISKRSGRVRQDVRERVFTEDDDFDCEVRSHGRAAKITRHRARRDHCQRSHGRGSQCLSSHGRGEGSHQRWGLSLESGHQSTSTLGGNRIPRAPDSPSRHHARYSSR